MNRVLVNVNVNHTMLDPNVNVALQGDIHILIALVCDKRFCLFFSFLNLLLGYCKTEKFQIVSFFQGLYHLSVRWGKRWEEKLMAFLPIDLILISIKNITTKVVEGTENFSYTILVILSSSYILLRSKGDYSKHSSGRSSLLLFWWVDTF